jgi:uncharacterized protein YgiM (DUF1202 family)
MFRLTALLCAALFLGMLLADREGGEVRKGLAGGYAPLRLEKEDIASSVQTAAVAPATAAPETAAAPAPAKAPARAEPATAAATPAPQPAPARVIPAAALATEDAGVTSGLTLSLPLVDASAPLPEAPAAAEPAAPKPRVAYISGTKVNVRSGPSAETEALAQLLQGEAVLATPSDTPGWTLIRIEGDGLEGYVATRFLTEGDAFSLSPSGD